jgi:hypothetical protein
MIDEDFYKLRKEYEAVALRSPPEQRLRACNKFLADHPDYARECLEREPKKSAPFPGR